MDETELLKTIYSTWINRITHSLANGAGVREDIRAQLDRFFEQLVAVVDTGDPSRLDPLLKVWATSLTETDLKSSQSNIVKFLREIMLQTYQVCRETLDNEKALELITTLGPAFAFAFEKAASFESQARVTYISNQLKQAQNTLERLDRSKSDFIAVAAHELRTPLTLIEGYTAMLRESRDQNTMTALETELMNGINTGASRLKIIIDDMIDVSLIDNNLIKLNFQPVWINRLVAVLLTELGPAAQERNQELTFEKFAGCDDVTFADPERILQVLRNVLTNAIKYTPDGGRVLIEGRKLPGFIEIIVRDSGIGIDPDDHSIIFDKFSRLGNISLHSSGKTKFKGGGPGLGLHIARGIIEAHGGAIWVESPGYDEKNLPGSTFHILLPVQNTPPDSRMASIISSIITPSQQEDKTL